MLFRGVIQRLSPPSILSVLASGGMIGKATLVGGTVAISISGLTTSDEAFLTLVAPGGTIGTGGHKAVCTANTLTITSVLTNGSSQALDTSTLRYVVIRPV